MGTNTPLLKIDNLHFKTHHQTILDSVSAELHDGKFVGLIGPNGAGKSTLLRCIYRYLSPSSGALSLLEKPIEEYSRKAYAQHVAAVLQEIPSQFNLPVSDVVKMGLTPHQGLFSQHSNSQLLQVEQAIAHVGLTNKFSDIFDTLSGGEKQRVMIARAMVQTPTLLVMDEPTSHLDVRFQIQIMEMVKGLKCSVLSSFHDLNLAAALCDEIWVLNKGKLVKVGTPSEVLTEALLSEVFGVCTHIELIPHSDAPSQLIPHIRYHYGY